MRLISLVFILVLRIEFIHANETIFIEAEGFDSWGGWVMDQQSIDLMGSAYLMAHGMGNKVNDAKTKFSLKSSGTYQVWVRTRDWAGPWKNETNSIMKSSGFPGKFKVQINGQSIGIFGTEKSEWHWQKGHKVLLKNGTHELSLKDLTGFNGRCDAIIISQDLSLIPPNTLQELTKFRRSMLGTETPIDGGTYDLVVIGGGMGGICSALSAARYGLKVALIQNRPVLGGNNSSEVRVGLSGLIRQKPYINLGNLVDELDPVGHWTYRDAKKNPTFPRSQQVIEIIKNEPHRKEHNAGPAINYDDNKKFRIVSQEKNLSLFLNTHMNEVEMNGNSIKAVAAIDLKTGKRIRFQGRLFVDCTGDGTLGYLAGADFRQGREAKSMTKEDLAPSVEDKLMMGTSIQWYAKATKFESSFPLLPWAVKFDDQSLPKNAHNKLLTKGDWDWEFGIGRDAIKEIELIRDYSFRVIFGIWSVLKNSPKWQEKYKHQALKWVAYIGGKRESRRLLGDVILQQQDIIEMKKFDDASFTTTWTIDLHYPKKPTCACEAFLSNAEHVKIKPYPVPYRTLYSRNINNLMMAGRCISVTHVALGTVRVMRTIGMMGEIIGMAAYLTKKHNTSPRGIYQKYLGELKALMTKGVPKTPGVMLNGNPTKLP